MDKRKTLHLEIATPTKSFFTGDIDAISFTTTDGEIGVYPDHLPLIANVKASPIRIKIDDEWKSAFVADGFLEVARNHIIMLVDSAEWPEDIDFNRAERARQRAEERLHYRLSAQDYATTQAALARALARLKLKK